MTNIQWGVCLYILGMFVTIYHSIISDENGIKLIREQIYDEMPFSKKTNCVIIVIICLFAGALWPYCWFSDVVKFFKKRS